MSHQPAIRDEELKNREELILDIITLANELGVSFAFPSQTSYLIPSENLTYPMNKEVTEGESAIEAGRNLAEEIFKSHHQK